MKLRAVSGHCVRGRFGHGWTLRLLAAHGRQQV